jgi:hypothetical protein
LRTTGRETVTPLPAPPTAPLTQEERYRILLEAFSAETMKLLDYLDTEYFEDIQDDERFDNINNLLSLYLVMKRDPNDAQLGRFFSQLEKHVA